MRIFLKYNRWAFLWGFLIILLTALPGRVIPEIPVFLDLFQPDKLLHILIFGIYVILQIRGFRQQAVFPILRRNAVLITLLIALVLSAGTELMQAFVIPLRVGSVFDFIANAAGCLAGWGFASAKNKDQRSKME